MFKDFSSDAVGAVKGNILNALLTQLNHRVERTWTPKSSNRVAGLLLAPVLTPKGLSMLQTNSRLCIIECNYQLMGTITVITFSCLLAYILSTNIDYILRDTERPAVIAPTWLHHIALPHISSIILSFMPTFPCPHTWPIVV